MAIALQVLLLSVALSCTSGFRFDEGGERGNDLFGDAGLMNAVPRIGRRSMGSTPFGNRFRFRFNNWLDASKLGGDSFRFNDNSDSNGVLHKRNNEDGKESPSDHKVGLDLKEEDDSSADFKRYVLADTYWREYLNDLASRRQPQQQQQQQDEPFLSPLPMFLGGTGNPGATAMNSADAVAAAADPKLAAKLLRLNLSKIIPRNRMYMPAFRRR